MVAVYFSSFPPFTLYDQDQAWGRFTDDFRLAHRVVALLCLPLKIILSFHGRIYFLPNSSSR